MNPQLVRSAPPRRPLTIRAKVRSVRRLTRTPLIVPRLDAEDSPVRLVQWLIEESAPVSTGDRVAELLADGVLFHVSCDVSGVLVRIERHRGADVRTGETLAWIECEAE